MRGEATTALADKTRQASIGAILLVGATLVAMKARLAWYGITHWQLGNELHALAATVAAVDAGAFWLAAALTLSSWIYLVGKPAPASNAALCRQLRRAVHLGAFAAAALALPVTCDGVLTALRLLGRDLSAGLLIPLASMLAEVALAGVLIFRIGGLRVRLARTTSLIGA